MTQSRDPLPAIEIELARLARRGGLDMRRRLVILTGGATAAGDEERLAVFFSDALRRGAPAGQLSEIVLQTYLFAGYPRTINALFVLRTTGGSFPAFEESPPPDGPGSDPTERFADRGRRLCRSIYGANYAALRQNIRALHPDLDRWMVEEGYGRVLGRPGLDVVTRELAALTALIVLDVPRQIRAHLQGSRNVGASPDEIEETLHQATLFASADATARARGIWRNLRPPER